MSGASKACLYSYSTAVFSLQDHRLALSGHIPGKDFPYSDHEGVEATFELRWRENPIPVKERIFDGKRDKCTV